LLYEYRFKTDCATPLSGVVEDGVAHSSKVTGIRDLGTELEVSNCVKGRPGNPPPPVDLEDGSTECSGQLNPGARDELILSNGILLQFTTVNTERDAKVIKSPDASVLRNGAVFWETHGNA
jgi:hypothetical protein